MSARTCSIEGCGKKHNARGLCHMHYWRLLHFGDPLPDAPPQAPRYKEPKLCAVDGCDGPARRRGWCEKHYKRWRTRGTTSDPPRREAPRCSVDGCDRPHLAGGYCRAHYQRVTANGEPRDAIPVRTPHGHATQGQPSPTYTSWSAMLYRCTSPGCRAWKNYGGRGITVCEQWSGPGGFAHFLADMGERPDWANGGLDRIDPNGNYEPGNCRWATRTTQARNQRRHAA